MSNNMVRVTQFGQTVCWINKHPGIWKCCVKSPSDGTLKSLWFADISDVHRWLDREFPEWVAS